MSFESVCTRCLTPLQGHGEGTEHVSTALSTVELFSNVLESSKKMFCCHLRRLRVEGSQSWGHLYHTPVGDYMCTVCRSCAWATSSQTLKQRPPRGPSNGTNGLKAHGPSSSRIRLTSLYALKLNSSSICHFSHVAHRWPLIATGTSLHKLGSHRPLDRYGNVAIR